MTYTPLETGDGTALSVRVKTQLGHAQEDLTEECPESPNKPPTDGGYNNGTLSRQSGLVEVCACSSASFKANYLGTSPFVSVGSIESQLLRRRERCKRKWTCRSTPTGHCQKSLDRELD